MHQALGHAVALSMLSPEWLVLYAMMRALIACLLADLLQQEFGY